MTFPSLQLALQTTALAPLSLPAQVISILADIIKILEALVIAFGAAQLWLSRSERREAEARNAALARKAANYQAWQVINSAHGRGGSGGRTDALKDLDANGVSLAGVNLDGAWLEGLALPGAKLPQATFRDARLNGADLSEANLAAADFGNAVLEGACLRGAFLKGANVEGASLATADLSGADLQNLRGWEGLASVSYANLRGVRNAPPGFHEWAMARGAVEGELVLTETMTHGFSTQWRTI